jgi:hypothetical protein
MRANSKKILVFAGWVAALAVLGAGAKAQSEGHLFDWFDQIIHNNSSRMMSEGRQIFRYDTFGDEEFWGKTLRLHEAINGKQNGGIGSGVSPQLALEVGLKVDSEALPSNVKNQIKNGQIDLKNPKSTIALLKLNAVVGMKGFFDSQGNLKSVGVTCALCHSSVDNSFSKGIGRRLDGWPNRDLNVGAITGLSPDLSVVNKLLGVADATTRKVLAAWGPGKFDAELFLDGKGFRPDGKTAAVLIPPAFGLAGVNLHTSTGWGSITYWNAFVANLEMHGQGTFFDPRLNNERKFPVAARARLGMTRAPTDLITSKLPALHFYQLAIAAPMPPADSFDEKAALRGRNLFHGKAQCAACHAAPIYTEPGWNMHSGDELGIDNFQALRSPEEKYRTTPLRGLWAHPKGGYYHDGRFADLMAVVEHYDQHRKLGLSQAEKSDLVEFLKSL